MRLDLVTLPNAVHRGFAYPLGLSHRPTTPMRGSPRMSLQGPLDDGGDFVQGIPGLAAPPRSHLPQTIRTFLGESTPPQGCSLRADLQILANLSVLTSVRRGQNDTAALGHLLGSPVGGDPTFQ